MSEVASARPSRQASPRPAAARPPLRVVRRHDAPARPTLALISVAALVGAMLAVLLLNTAMAKGSFVLEDLQAQSNQLSETEEALGYAVDAQRAPAVLAQRAIDMGMVPAASAAFVRLSDGAIIGVANPAEPRDNFKVAAQSTGSSRDGDDATSTTTVTTAGTVTTTTVTTAKGDVIETTKTSVDSETGRTTTTTSTAPAPAAPADPSAAQAEPDGQPAPSADPNAVPAEPEGQPGAQGSQ